MIDYKIKNPLLPINLFFCLNCLMYTIPLISKLMRGIDITDILASNKGRIIGLSLSIVFIVFYLRKSILAWWIASLFMGIMFISKIIIKNELPEIKFVFVFLGLYFLVLCYLWSKYKAYKEHIASSDKSSYFGQFKTNILKARDKFSISKPRNPLKGVTSATVALAIYELSYLFPTENKPENYLDILISFSHQTLLFILLFAFVFSYRQKTILAWWISMIHVPSMWLIYNMFNPFNMVQSVITLCIFTIMACYLGFVYKPYKTYISTGVSSNDDSQTLKSSSW